MADRADKFIQPIDGIEVTHVVDGPRTLLSPDVVKKYADRIRAGEDRDKVMTELAMEIVELEDGLREDGLLPELEVPEEVLRTAGYVEEQHPRDDHGRWTDGGGDLNDDDKKIIAEDWAWPDQPGRMEYESMRIPSTPEGKRMTEILNKLPVHDGVIYRGLALSAEDANRLMSGREFKLEMHSSASKDSDVAITFADANTPLPDEDVPVIMELHGRGRDINAHLPEELQGTEEVVAMAGTRYKYIGSSREVHYKNKAFLRIKLREIR